MVRDDALETVKLSESSAEAWRRVRGQAFAGVTVIQTTKTMYRFVDGVLASRATRPLDESEPEWESTEAMAGIELIGFATNEGGFWSFSSKWRQGCQLVLFSENKTFTLKPPTRACAVERPSLPIRRAPSRSDVFDRPRSKPVTVRRPSPPSLTRIQTFPASAR